MLTERDVVARVQHLTVTRLMGELFFWMKLSVFR